MKIPKKVWLIWNVDKNRFVTLKDIDLEIGSQEGKWYVAFPTKKECNVRNSYFKAIKYNITST